MQAANNEHPKMNVHDPIQLNLDAVTRRLARPHFLQHLTPSRLPSRAASDTSLSPGEAPLSARGSFGQHFNLQRPSHLNLTVASDHDHVPDHFDLVSILVQDPTADGHPVAVEDRVVRHLQTHFLAAHHAYATMAAERSFQTFSHGHQDLVLAVDFNYFGTRMVTASSDHRLKVWDKKDDAWALVDSWKAHDAEIVDVSHLHKPSSLSTVFETHCIAEAQSAIPRQPAVVTNVLRTIV